MGRGLPVKSRPQQPKPDTERIADEQESLRKALEEDLRRQGGHTVRELVESANQARVRLQEV